MEKQLILLLITAFVKAAVVSGIASFLLKKWNSQKKKYLTDFPFLMAISFIFLIAGKLFDIYLYYRFNETPNLGDLNFTQMPEAWYLAKSRFILCPVITLVPMVILMMIIWFGNKKKIQISFVSIWCTLALIGIAIAPNYQQLLTMNALIVFPPIILSIVTFFIINHQKRLPEINSLMLGIGWSLFIISQIIRPIWAKLGNGLWGLSWIGELVEMGIWIIIGLGFMLRTNYKGTSKSDKNKSSLESDPKDLGLEKENEPSNKQIEQISQEIVLNT